MPMMDREIFFHIFSEKWNVCVKRSKTFRLKGDLNETLEEIRLIRSLRI